MSSNKEKKLRTGFTTGAAAAASVKGALYLLLQGITKKTVRINFIGNGHTYIKIHKCVIDKDKAICSVIKDAGDDPDVTNKAEIGTYVEIAQGDSLYITGGEGVGVATKAGLEIEIGEPAITSGPRQMIKTAVNEVIKELEHPPLSIKITIFVPEGKAIAKKTLNSRLGIIGGISILGTTGVVRPMSHEAYIATIKASLSIAKAHNEKTVFFTTGRRSEKYAQKIWSNHYEDAFVQIGDFFKSSLELASEMGFKSIVLVAFFGKALKMAYGIAHTHAAKSDMCLKQLSDWTNDLTNDQDMSFNILNANTARQAFFLIKDKYPQIISKVGIEMKKSGEKFIKSQAIIRSVIIDFDGNIVFDSHNN